MTPKPPLATRLFRQLYDEPLQVKQPDAKIHHGGTATASVLENAHLVYMILSHVDPASLMHCSRVCKLFEDTVTTSDKLQKALFLLPDTRSWILFSEHGALHPMGYPTDCMHCHSTDMDNRMSDPVSFHTAHLAHPLLLGKDRPITKSIHSSWHRNTGLASWLLHFEDLSSPKVPLLDMFISQPPVKEVVLHLYTDIKLGRQTRIYEKKGVTFRHIVDAMDSTVVDWDQDDGVDTMDQEYDDETAENRRDRLNEVHFRFEICFPGLEYVLSTEVFPWLDESETSTRDIHYDIAQHCRTFLANWETPAWEFSTEVILIGDDSDCSYLGLSASDDDEDGSCGCILCEGTATPVAIYHGRMLHTEGKGGVAAAVKDTC